MFNKKTHIYMTKIGVNSYKIDTYVNITNFKYCVISKYKISVNKEILQYLRNLLTNDFNSTKFYKNESENELQRIFIFNNAIKDLYTKQLKKSSYKSKL